MAERTKKGNIKVAPASVISDSASAPESLNKIRKTREFFKKLSLNALKNWHQNSGAKRFVVIKVLNMALGVCRSRAYCRELLCAALILSGGNARALARLRDPSTLGRMTSNSEMTYPADSSRSSNGEALPM